MIIECVLLAVPIWLVWGLQTDFTKKFTVVAVFWLRLPYALESLTRFRTAANSFAVLSSPHWFAFTSSETRSDLANLYYVV